jgi:nitroreductase
MLRAYISSLKAPFGVDARIMMIRAGDGKERVKYGTYGSTGGAGDFLVLAYRDGTLAGEGAAYIFEQAVLYCTSIGLGTCWLGGSFNRKDFKGGVDLEPGEKVRIVSPVGYAAGRKRLWDVFINADGHHRSRKPFDRIFFDHDFATPLTPGAAGPYREPLEMIRMAPSANNFQPWRVVKDEDALHFYHKKMIGGFDDIDMGIALCHFGESCRELGIAGAFKPLPQAPPTKDATYSISWQARPVFTEIQSGSRS